MKPYLGSCLHPKTSFLLPQDKLLDYWRIPSQGREREEKVSDRLWPFDEKWKFFIHYLQTHTSYKQTYKHSHNKVFTQNSSSIEFWSSGSSPWAQKWGTLDSFVLQSGFSMFSPQCGIHRFSSWLLRKEHPTEVIEILRLKKRREWLAVLWRWCCLMLE